MDDRDVTTSPSTSITYSLTSRLQMSGEVALVLRLYRARTLALTSTLMICDRQHMPDAIRVCRSHLGKLGVAERDTPQRTQRSAAATQAA